ncbi:unnamed protein product [Fusarium graminearum]|nr:unnamed protein product [Fusarium graminearum]
MILISSDQDRSNGTNVPLTKTEAKVTLNECHGTGRVTAPVETETRPGLVPSPPPAPRLSVAVAAAAAAAVPVGVETQPRIVLWPLYPPRRLAAAAAAAAAE